MSTERDIDTTDHRNVVVSFLFGAALNRQRRIVKRKGIQKLLAPQVKAIYFRQSNFIANAFPATSNGRDLMKNDALGVGRIKVKL